MNSFLKYTTNKNRNLSCDMRFYHVKYNQISIAQPPNFHSKSETMPSFKFIVGNVIALTEVRRRPKEEEDDLIREEAAAVSGLAETSQDQEADETWEVACSSEVADGLVTFLENENENRFVRNLSMIPMLIKLTTK